MMSDLKYTDTAFVLEISPIKGDSLEETYEKMSNYLEEAFNENINIMGQSLFPSKRILDNGNYEIQVILGGLDANKYTNLVEQYIELLMSYNEIKSGTILDITYCNPIWENGKVTLG